MGDLITPDVVAAVIRAESSGRSEAVGAGGERGLMQLHQPAWEDVRAAVPSLAGYDYDQYAFDKDVNRQFGTAYLNLTRARLPAAYQESLPHVLAGYNFGIGNLAKVDYDLARVPKITQDYIARITTRLGMRPRRSQ